MQVDADIVNREKWKVRPLIGRMCRLIVGRIVIAAPSRWIESVSGNPASAVT